MVDHKTCRPITKEQLADGNTCKICYVQLVSLKALKRHIVTSHMNHSVDNSVDVKCPECSVLIPEERLAIHLKYCQAIDSNTGEEANEISFPSSSSGFFEENLKDKIEIENLYKSTLAHSTKASNTVSY